LTKVSTFDENALMKLSSKEEYGLRCLVQLAQAPKGAATIHEIAKAEGLTPAYVAKILAALRRSGLVTATRGQGGGYALARPADAIDLSEAITALGGRLYAPGFCALHAGGALRCAHDGNCSIRPVLVGLDRLIHDALSKMTLKSLVRSEPAMHAFVQVRLGA
jgi:Rrf2 family protein